MMLRMSTVLAASMTVMAIFAHVGCTSPSPTVIRDPQKQSPLSLATLEGVPGIVDPSNLSWPRQVRGMNGVVTILHKPRRIITASVGHDEVTLALVPVERLVGVGGATKNPTYSNVASLVHHVPLITRDPETIIARDPDVIVTSPFFGADGIDALTKIGVPVIQTALKHHPEARIHNILLMGYIYGEEERALAFADEVEARYQALTKRISTPQTEQPRVLILTQYSDKIWTAGHNSTEGAVITAAGGVNAAAQTGVTGNQTTSLEGIIAMMPDIIIIPQPLEFGGEAFRQQLLADEALASVPAIKSMNIHIAESKFFTTLSFWNIRGAEELSKILRGEQFDEIEAPRFTLPQ